MNKLFNVVHPNQIIDGATGVYIKREKGKTQGLLLILSFIGKKQREFVVNFGRTTVVSLPRFYLLFQWSRTDWFFNGKPWRIARGVEPVGWSL